MRPSECPSEDLLSRYAAGATSEVEAQTLDTHLGKCTACLGRLDHLVGRPDSFVAGLRRPSATVADDSPALAKAVAAVLADAAPTRAAPRRTATGGRAERLSDCGRDRPRRHGARLPGRASALEAGGLPNTPLRKERVFLHWRHYLPQIQVPVLMLNGQLDPIYPVQESQEPMVHLLGSAIKEHYVHPHGHHMLPPEVKFGRMLPWFDQHLGRPARQPQATP